MDHRERRRWVSEVARMNEELNEQIARGPRERRM
jgi:hypothetical protein